MHQISSQLLAFYRRHYKTYFGLFFRTQYNSMTNSQTLSDSSHELSKFPVDLRDYKAKRNSSTFSEFPGVLNVTELQLQGHYYRVKTHGVNSNYIDTILPVLKEALNKTAYKRTEG